MSSKRVIDVVPMNLRHYLLKRFCSKLNGLPAQLAAEMLSPQTTDAEDRDSGEEGEASRAKGGSRQQRVGAGNDSGSKRLNPAQLMAEDESTAERRAQLHRQREQLQHVKRILSVF